MPYPYEPYDPQLAGAKPPQAIQLQAYGMYGQPNTTPSGLSGIPPSMPQGFDSNPMSDPQAGARAGIMAGLQGSNVGGMGEPIPPEYLAKAQQLQQLMSPGPVEQRFLEANAAVPENVHGLRAHLAGIGKGLLMGGLGGAVLGGVDPSMANRAWHRAQLPGMAQAAQYEQQDRQAQLNRAKELEGLTGIDPITGLRSPTSLNRDYMNALAFGRLNQGQERIDQGTQRIGIQQQRASTYSQHLKGLDENNQKKFLASAYKNGDLNGDQEALAAYGKLLGLSGPAHDAFVRGEWHPEIDGDGNIARQNLRTGEVTSSGTKSFKATEESHKQTHNKEMESQGRARLGQGAQRLSQQQLKALSDAEEKEVKSLQKPSMFGPDSRPMEEQQAEYGAKVQAVRDKYAQQKQVSTGGAASLKDPNIGRTVRGQGGKTGTIVGLNLDKTYRINWR